MRSETNCGISSVEISRDTDNSSTIKVFKVFKRRVS